MIYEQSEQQKINFNQIKSKNYENGNIYDGELVDGKKEGFGKMTYKNGNVYEGQWKNDQKNG